MGVTEKGGFCNGVKSARGGSVTNGATPLVELKFNRNIAGAKPLLSLLSLCWRPCIDLILPESPPDGAGPLSFVPSPSSTNDHFTLFCNLQ